MLRRFTARNDVQTGAIKFNNQYAGLYVSYEDACKLALTLGAAKELAVKSGEEVTGLVETADSLVSAIFSEIFVGVDYDGHPYNIVNRINRYYPGESE